MINFAIAHYMAALRLVSQEIAQAQFRVEHDGEGALLLEPGKERIRNNLGYVLKKSDDLGLEGVRNRVERIFTKLRTQPEVLCLDIANEMNILLEAFEDDTKYLYLYAYPREKVKRFLIYLGRMGGGGGGLPQHRVCWRSSDRSLRREPKWEYAPIACASWSMG